MHAFSQLLDRLSLEPRRLAKEALLVRYFRETADPDRGYALAALTGGLNFKNAKPALLRALINDRTDPQLFALSYDFVGDLSETIALMWPAGDDGAATEPRDSLPLSAVVETLETAGKTDVPRLLTGWLDRLDETGRWALLKLVTGGLRVGVSARLAKTAIARLGGLDVAQIEEVWHGLKPPYETLFAWAEGRSGRPDNQDPAPFRPVMLAHPLDEERELPQLDAAAFAVEWKWDGIRVQAAAGQTGAGETVRRLYSRTGEDISRAFPDIVELLDFNASIDGELLVVSDGIVRPFSDLQKRLNRKTAGPKLIREYPAAIRAYDLLELEGEDLRGLPFETRREKLGLFIEALSLPAIELSPMLEVGDWDQIAAARSDPHSILDAANADAVEGLMLKRRDALYVSGRPKGLWFKWKREPYLVDAVLMYAQRGHGKRSSFYSDYTFGVWRAGADGDELVPVGKAYFGFTDDELREIDRFVRNNTLNRFGPVREVKHGRTEGLVLEVAFEGLNRSKRHKSGVAMRFPRISRLRWDKPPNEADRIETLEALLPKAENPAP
ncbi:cisplatin damage response ATP-dependent DNA ligase [Roseibium sp. MMSF_3412]|uniref:cisplatin damage response ATP-dependent DNA ligase n=1 Tax=Roseibium sp. MMSF_3412 TaxID=3046712 RepID=UPI00273F0CFC|nr:cisplatin damage response ATP-dependent DNA ligase [Roseibium sp. MMSF_3412]